MEIGRRRIDEFLYKTKEAFLSPKDEVLELGAGRNPFLSVMFSDYEKFTPTDKHIYSGCVPGIIELDAEDFGSSILAETEWQAIYFCETLEHCPHPWLVFKEAYEHLVLGGLFVVSAPCYYRVHEGYTDVRSPTARKQTETDDGEAGIAVKDYWRVTPSGLAQLFADAGFGLYYVESFTHETGRYDRPFSVVGWGGKYEPNNPGQIEGFIHELPEDWVEQHLEKERLWQMNCRSHSHA